MATQAAIIADTIAGMKRAFSSHDYSYDVFSTDTAARFPASDSGDSVDRYTNRGNKLKRKAQYVREGQLDRPNGPKIYKKSIEHTGYHRNVISRNPRRYDANGDRLEEDEEDEEADAAAAEANPYSGVILHELLAPLTSAADLSTHPSLSIPYLTPVLSNMTQEACEMLQRERNTMRGAKQLLTKLRGDSTWIPCGSLDSDVDDVIFDTSKVFDECIRQRPSSKLAGKGDRTMIFDTTLLPLEDNLGTSPQARQTADRDMEDGEDSAPLLAQTNGHKPNERQNKPASPSDRSYVTATSQSATVAVSDGHDSTTIRQDFEVSRASNGAHPPLSEIPETPHPNPENILVATMSTVPSDNNATDAETETLSRVRADETRRNQASSIVQMPELDEKFGPQDDEARNDSGGLPTHVIEDVSMVDVEESQAAGDGLPPIGHRMTTRAQAQAVSDNTTSSRTRSASVASSSVPTIHPLFMMPSGVCPDRDFRLPPEQAEATRRILMSYIQKQEEVCRGTEKLYNGFLKAQRMKMNVLDSCKAEGHLGEMSDGEDWYDKEEWGLEEDLRKGHDEEEDDVGTQHKKTRQRRT
ncbi:MAG: hypothetical protein Q9166_000373 [cf. Caloplaca sp. 2 TL-2023]